MGYLMNTYLFFRNSKISKLQRWKKYLEKILKNQVMIDKNKKFDTCFRVIFDHYCQKVIFGGEVRH